MTEALRITDLSVAYGRIDAVRGVSLAVPEASLVAVIGPNGAGKTTLLHAAMGVLRGRGEVRLFGEDISGASIEERVRAGLCLVPETRALFGDLSVQDNLELGAWRHRAQGGAARRAELARVFSLFPRLAERRRQHAATLSGGERQMLAMGRALMARPRVLMLDEPSLGLAPLIVREILAHIARLRQDGVSVLLVEQNARAALAAAESAYVLEGGQVTLSGPAAALASDARVVHTYLGLGAEGAN
jgi:branched-chain amino acid transport system ATP-binding protein